MDILQPDLKLFKKKYDQQKPQLLYTALSADLYTPVSILLKFEKEKYIFLFESVEKGSQKGRYSVIGIKPDLIWECKNSISTVKELVNKKFVEKKESKISPIDSLKNLFKKNKFKIPNYLPPMSSGLFGYLGYEMISHFEDVKFNNKDILNLPDSVFIRPSLMLIFDNVKDNLFIVNTVWPYRQKTSKTAFLDAKNLINKTLVKLRSSNKKNLIQAKSNYLKKKSYKKGVVSSLNY